jgi:hypothetical protein
MNKTLALLAALGIVAASAPAFANEHEGTVKKEEKTVEKTVKETVTEADHAPAAGEAKEGHEATH